MGKLTNRPHSEKESDILIPTGFESYDTNIERN